MFRKYALSAVEELNQSIRTDLEKIRTLYFWHGTICVLHRKKEEKRRNTAIQQNPKRVKISQLKWVSLQMTEI